MLEKHADGLFSLAAPGSMMGLQLGTRMTVVQLKNGGVLLHSPVPLTDAVVAEIQALGPVQHIIAPNLFHHLHAGTAKNRFPEAQLHAPEALKKKRPDLTIDHVLSEKAHPDWEGQLLPITVQGCMLGETVLFHPASRSLVSADLLENFITSDHWWTRWYLKATGIHGKPGLSRVLYFTYQDKKRARESLDRILEWDFDRVVLAHGNVLETGGVKTIRETYEWL